jgi:iron(III) transport system substrate-binding protein
MRRAWLLVLLSACSPEQPVTQTPAEPVVVYAAYADKAYLPGLFERYSDATGVTVIVRHGDRESIVDDLIADNILPPADVIVTPSLRGMTRAADEGALRPLPRSLVGAQVPDWLRDADGYWVALGYRVPLIVYDTRARNLELPATFEDLADERFRGRLCLSTSVNFVNRTIIATLIGKLGERPTELVVRGWIANLATGVFASEQ